MTPMDARTPIAIRDLDLLVIGPGYRTFIKNQVDELAELCASVTVLVRYNRFADVSEYVPIDSLRPHRREARIDRSDTPGNVTVVPIPMYYLPIDYHYERLGAKLHGRVVEAIDEHDVDFDLVHAHFTRPSGNAAARLSEETGVPYVLTVHENDGWLTDLYESGDEDVRRAWRDAATVVRVNEKDVSLLAEFNDDVRAVPNGFSREEFPVLDRRAARRDLGLSPDEEVVFGLGALQARKRWGDLVEAMATVAPRRESVTCAVAGRGPEKESLRRRVTDLGLESTVRVLGFVPQDELARWMNAADVFVLPSEAEGNPTVLFEALGCGTPYVGTDVGGVPEIVTSEAYGLLCEPGDPDVLADRILEGLEKEWDRERIRAYAEQFTWENVAERIADIYRDVLADEAARRASR